MGKMTMLHSQKATEFFWYSSIVCFSGHTSIVMILLIIMFEAIVEGGKATLTLLLWRIELCTLAVDDNHIWTSSYGCHRDDRFAWCHTLQLVLDRYSIHILLQELFSDAPTEQRE